MTLVNHEPGPSTTQSASMTAATASGQAGGVGRVEGRPRGPARAVTATSTWPRTVVTSSGAPGEARDLRR